MPEGSADLLRFLARKARWATALLLLLVGVVLWRLWDLQMRQGPALAAAARGEAIRTVALPAVRGEIVDRHGIVLAEDVPSFAADLSFTPTPPSAAETALLVRILGISPASIRAAATKLSTGLPFAPVLLAGNLTPVQQTLLVQDAPQLPGVSVVAQPRRVYPTLPGATDPGNQLAANILGFVRAGRLPGEVRGAAGIEGSYNRLRVGGRTIGLAGQDGQKVIEVNRLSQPVRTLGVVAPRPGDNVVLTIDAKLQAVLQRALTKQLAALRTRTFGSDGGPFPQADAAGAVVIDVRNGQILASASEPTFSPDPFAAAAQSAPGSAASVAFSRQYAAWAAERGRPFVDHVLSDTAPPGSTFKPITAIAALQAGVITPWQRMSCPPFISLGGGYFLHNWIPVWDGNLNLYQAIAFSCDTYFYRVGAATGIAAIDRVAAEFGLGQLTGQHDLLGEENPGQMSSPAVAMRAAHAAWTQAFTMQSAIGQGFSAFNPLEMADYVAALANGGTLWRPYFVREVVSPGGQVLYHQRPKVRRRIPLSPAIVNAIHTAMADVTQNHPSWAADGPVATFGTAYWPFYGFTRETARYLGQAITVAGKTGTAQLGNGTTPDGWWISFAPANNPQIAVIVFSQHANEGFVGGAPVAREVYDYYFGLDRAMWKAGKANQIIPSVVQMYFGEHRQVPIWWGPPPAPAKPAAAQASPAKTPAAPASPAQSAGAKPAPAPVRTAPATKAANKAAPAPAAATQATPASATGKASGAAASQAPARTAGGTAAPAAQPAPRG